MKKPSVQFTMCLAFVFVLSLIFSSFSSVGIVDAQSKAKNEVRYVDTVGTQGLVAHYTFDDSPEDWTVQSNHGSVNGKITYVKGMIDNGASFNGSSYIEVPSSDSLNLTKAFTISAWLYKDGAGPKGSSPIVCKGEGDYLNEETPYALYHDEAGYYPSMRLVNADDHREYQSEIPVSHQKWHLLTVSSDGKTIKFFVDGVLRDRHTWTGGELFRGPGSLFIGADPVDGTKFFKGIIDDLRIYNRVLTDKEIKALYDDVMKTKDLTGKMVAHYKFDGDAKDSSGNKLDGKAMSSITYANGISGKAAKFNGSSYIEVADNDLLDFNESFSVSVWLYNEKTDRQVYFPVVTKGEGHYFNQDTPYSIFYNYYSPSGRFVNIEDHKELLGQAQVSPLKWHMLTATFDSKAKSFKVYIDGVLKDKFTWSAGELFSSPGKLYIGADTIDGSKYFRGLMDDMRLYNYALTDKAIKDLYAATKEETIKITPDPAKPLVLTVKQTTKIKVTGNAGDLTSKATYQSSNAKVATVDKTGTIRAIAKGTANIAVKINNTTQVIKVTVK